MPNVTVASFDGLLVDFMEQIDATIIIRGLRAISDYEYELQIAQTNHKVNPKVDTVFLTSSLEYAYLSSTIVKSLLLTAATFPSLFRSSLSIKFMQNII